MNNDTVLVTGGAGFIGQHLTTELLSLGRKVTVLDDFSTGLTLAPHPMLRVIEGDISNPLIREEALYQVKSVINLAAIASVSLCESEPELSSKVNFLAAENLFREASNRDVSAILHASTSALYGVPEELPLTENSSIHPIGKYGLDKESAENALLSIKTTPVCALRLFNVFGLGQKRGSPYSGVLTIFADRISKQQPLTIFGDGLQTRDFIHVKDVVSAFISCLYDLEKEGQKSMVNGKKFNVCSGESLTLLDVVEAFSSASTLLPEINFEPPREGDILHSLGSFDELNKSIGWTPTQDFSQRLGELLL
ncbi:MAG TPA: NAD-dependent epimerase/dehydratase family protein [Candidatus Thalassarchaeaceae archaeon]|mgnify:CR=1 FL=1|nr:NAD-dependent epimerase/dehydratase family protein [Candidatus Thalassarchaeaceae archaeon]